MGNRLNDSGFRSWTPDQLPDLSGRTILITGANSGLGLESAKMLHHKGASILVGARNATKAAAAADEIRKAGSGDGIDIVDLDLADLDSVRAAAALVSDRHPKLDAIVNNAGVMQTPQLESAQGYELQIATNHLGHFLLNALLYPNVKAASGRIVPVSSFVHHAGTIDFDDLMLANSYSPTKAYSQSKLANLLYALELHRRLTDAGSPVTCISCHPGYSNTNLQSTGPTGLLKVLYKFSNALVAQSAREGAYSEVLSAAGDEAVPGSYYGPQGMKETRGRVSDATVSSAAQNTDDAARLWDLSEKFVDFTWTF